MPKDHVVTFCLEVEYLVWKSKSEMFLFLVIFRTSCFSPVEFGSSMNSPCRSQSSHFPCRFHRSAVTDKWTHEFPFPYFLILHCCCIFEEASAHQRLTAALRGTWAGRLAGGDAKFPVWALAGTAALAHGTAPLGRTAGFKRSLAAGALGAAGGGCLIFQTRGQDLLEFYQHVSVLKNFLFLILVDHCHEIRWRSLCNGDFNFLYAVVNWNQTEKGNKQKWIHSTLIQKYPYCCLYFSQKNKQTKKQLAWYNGKRCFTRPHYDTVQPIPACIFRPAFYKISSNHWIKSLLIMAEETQIFLSCSWHVSKNDWFSWGRLQCQKQRSQLSFHKGLFFFFMWK